MGNIGVQSQGGSERHGGCKVHQDDERKAWGLDRKPQRPVLEPVTRFELKAHDHRPTGDRHDAASGRPGCQRHAVPRLSRRQQGSQAQYEQAEGHPDPTRPGDRLQCRGRGWHAEPSDRRPGHGCREHDAQRDAAPSGWGDGGVAQLLGRDVPEQRAGGRLDERKHQKRDERERVPRAEPSERPENHAARFHVSLRSRRRSRRAVRAPTRDRLRARSWALAIRARHWPTTELRRARRRQ